MVSAHWRVAVWGVAASLLLLPLVAMQFTDEVNWSAADFIVFGTMLVLACGTFELAARMTSDHAYRAAVAVAAATAFVLIWVNLAVGIIGSGDNPANLLFGGVLAVAIAGAAVARFRPRGLARAMVATAFAQVAVAATAIIAGWGVPASGALELLLLNAGFAVLWLASARLFRRSAPPRPSY